jgi:hypothetical protein
MPPDPVNHQRLADMSELATKGALDNRAQRSKHRLRFSPVNKMGFCNGPSRVNPIRAWCTKNIGHSLSFLVRLKCRFLVPA